MSLRDCYSIIALRLTDSRLGKVHVFEISSGSYANISFEYAKPNILNRVAVHLAEILVNVF